jgi:short-subunit dehydrogenase
MRKISEIIKVSALQKELAQHNVQVQLVSPMFIKTKMTSEAQKLGLSLDQLCSL